MVRSLATVKALIKVGYGCNENCTFCHTAELRHLEDSAERVEWKIDRAKRLGYSMVVLSGGEPTIRSELVAWGRRVAALGLDFGLVTNGLVLAYPDLVRELFERCRLRYVYMSLHGGDAKVHRSVVRADSFAQAIRAVENLAGLVPDLTVNCVVTRANVDHLRGVVERLLELDELVVKFSMTQPKGGAKSAYDVITPDVERCAAAVVDAIGWGTERARELGKKRFGFAHDGIPFCLLPGLEDLYDDLKTHRFAAMIETDEDDFVPVDDVLKVHTERCTDCSLRGACPGLYQGYYEARGDAALSPVTDRPRSNSFTFTPERDVPRPPGAPCPIEADGTRPYDRGRTLFLRLRDRMRLYRTETRDFSDAELLATKETFGQLYADVSRKLAPDDFERDLRLLVRSGECEACPARDGCPGAWEIASGHVFRESERAVREALGRLSGRVLDVGAGEARYLDALATLVREGRVRYVALDPDAGRLDLLRGRLPEAEAVVGSLEDAPLVGPFDHVLLLRSLNHLRDPALGLRRIVELVRPGGSIVVADDVPFGVLRDRTHARAAERGPAAFEHWRNDDAARALRRFEGLPVRLVERSDVRPGRANHWMLRLERTPGAPAAEAV